MIGMRLDQVGALTGSKHAVEVLNGAKVYEEGAGDAT